MAIVVSVVLGSVRPGRMGARAGQYVVQQLETLGAKVHLIDPVALDIPLFGQRYDYIPEAERSPALVELHAKFTESDAFVVVTPEYNHSYSPVITSLMNYFYHNEFYYKVAGIASYTMGPYGGVRAAIQLRPYLGELGLVSIPKILPFPAIQSLLNEDGSVQDGAAGAGALAAVSGGFFPELLWYAKANKAARAAGTL
ncbi:NADPH-dependent FMN reductase [Achlya hypogyna]|uniref:NADPH-dependent FMN reductase n=1 Tax=Achlya hypogyna TaxID=1202772 RepID=A0A1V9ZEK6_ACHHY|nr:NADPH-dependent FMN reductase [Achlya hypogyna]